jgi:hypothetical protein
VTSAWYREVLSRLPQGTQLLDVGIGTGAALVSCADLLRAWAVGRRDRRRRRPRPL